MTPTRFLLPLALAAAAAGLPAAAQTAEGSAWHRAVSRAYLGLHAGTPQVRVGCGVATLVCAPPSVSLYGGQAWGTTWGAELGPVDLGRAWRGAAIGRSQGLSPSLVGRAPLGASFGVFGRFGASYGFAEAPTPVAPALAGATGGGLGLSYGAGLSYDFSPRLSATIGWDSHDFRLSGRDPVRATSVGLQYRY